MPLSHQDNGVSMGGSLKEVSILKNCYVLADPKGRINLHPGNCSFDVIVIMSFMKDIIYPKEAEVVVSSTRYQAW